MGEEDLWGTQGIFTHFYFSLCPYSVSNLAYLWSPFSRLLNGILWGGALPLNDDSLSSFLPNMLGVGTS